MNEAELEQYLRQQRRRLFELRFQQATGQVENHRQVRDVRREIARTMTVQIELQRFLESHPAEDAPAPVAEAASPKPRRRRREAVAVAAETETETATPVAAESDASESDAGVSDSAEESIDE
ncbi:MAG: 50S ribosomal protein L29 [Candidatus Dormibacteraeota bacterium]|nr:50S ribosomal protein L29 [Candidatus Dormibacteraeota bacterium]